MKTKRASKTTFRDSKCLECGLPIPVKSDYLYFCSQECAADWGEDEAMIQHLAEQQRRIVLQKRRKHKTRPN